MNPLVCIGHRGAAGHEPENTLRSIRRALELGADGIEIDVRLAGGELVVFHDARLERTTDGRGYLPAGELVLDGELDRRLSALFQKVVDAALLNDFLLFLISFLDRDLLGQQDVPAGLFNASE